MISIPYEEVEFQPHSFGDPDGRLFFWNGELYRGISHEKTAFFRQLFEDGILEKLIQQHLVIGSELTDFSLEGYGMVLRHHRVPFVSYPHEWCAPMFKDAALAYVELRRQLLHHGLTLKDTHPWNLLFEGTRPVFVDVTSIRPLRGNGERVDHNKFSQYYLHPLILMSQGQERIVRCLLPDYEGILPSDFSRLANARQKVPTLVRRITSALRQQVPQRCFRLIEQPLRVMRPDSGRACLDRLQRELEDIRLCECRRTSINNGGYPVPGPLEELLSTLDPRSVLAIGTAATGLAAQAANAGKTVVCFDKDSTHISGIYSEARTRNQDLLPLVMDFTDPTPSRGLASHVSIAASERLRCQLVLALGVIRNSVNARRLRAEQIVHGLAEFSERWLIVDWAPDLKNDAPAPSGGLESRTLIALLGTHFTSVKRLSPYAGAGDLLLCEK